MSPKEKSIRRTALEGGNGPDSPNDMITSFQDARLSWFHHENYSRLKELSALGMHYQIESRRHIFYSLRAHKKDAVPLSPALTSQIECIRKVPIVTMESLMADGLHVSDFFHLAAFLIRSEQVRCVAPLRFGELLDTVENLLFGLERAEKANMQPEDFQLGYLGIVEKGWKRREELRRRFGSVVISEIPAFPLAYTSLLRVDPSAPDRMIESEFLDALGGWRDATPIEKRSSDFTGLTWRPRRPKTNSRSSWQLAAETVVNDKLIQLLDLVIWEEQHGCPISRSAKAELLFPNWGVLADDGPSAGIAAARFDPETMKKEELMNHFVSVEASAWALAHMQEISNLGLLIRASEELASAYAAGESDSEFVPSAKERAEIYRILCP